MKFLDSLKTYDKDNIPAATIKKIRDKYVPMASFNAKEVAKVSSGAFSFAYGSTDRPTVFYIGRFLDMQNLKIR